MNHECVNSRLQAFTTESGSEFHSFTTDNKKNSLRQRLDANGLNTIQYNGEFALKN